MDSVLNITLAELRIKLMATSIHPEQIRINQPPGKAVVEFSECPPRRAGGETGSEEFIETTHGTSIRLLRNHSVPAELSHRREWKVVEYSEQSEECIETTYTR